VGARFARLETYATVHGEAGDGALKPAAAVPDVRAKEHCEDGRFLRCDASSRRSPATSFTILWGLMFTGPVVGCESSPAAEHEVRTAAKTRRGHGTIRV
jgi:hypothetical protein